MRADGLQILPIRADGCLRLGHKTLEECPSLLEQDFSQAQTPILGVHTPFLIKQKLYQTLMTPSILLQ